LRRLFLIFSVGLIVPSAFLVYLGVSSIRAESRLLEKQNAERFGATADALVDQLRLSIQGLGAPFAAAGVNRASYQRLEETFQSDGGFLIVLDQTDKAVHPYRDGAESSKPLPALPEALQRRLDAAEKLEFSQKDFAGAAQEYRALMDDAESLAWRASLLARLAGCWSKLKSWGKAEEAYRDLQARFAAEKNEQGAPWGLMAAIRLGDVYAASGRAELAIDHQLRLLQDLLGSRWPLGASDDRFYIQRVEDALGRAAPRMTPAQRARWDALSHDVHNHWNRAGRTQAWLKSEWPVRQAALRRVGRSDQPTLLWPDAKNALAFFVYPVFDPSSAQRVRTFIVGMRTDSLMTRWKNLLDPAATAGALRYTIHPEQAAEPQDLVRSVPHILPPLQLSVSSVGASVSNQFAARRRTIYIAMVGLAGVVIVVALLVTWIAIQREMEVAELKARFVSSMSHELKTPLSIIDLVSQKLKRGRYESPQDVQEFYGMLTEETTRLKGLIDDVLDFSRVMENRKPYLLSPLDLVPLITATVKRFHESPIAQGHPVLFETSLTVCIVQGNADALSRLLLNLMENAFKYSPPDRVDVRVRLAVEAQHVLLTVEDHGYGIAPEEQAHVFDRFYRARSASQDRPISGTGLGLAIVKNIVDAHHGSITLTSRLHEGSQFGVRLPR